MEVYKSMMLLSAISSQFVTITIIALFMRLCFPSIAATQFAVYMASANLALSMGNGLVVPLDSLLDYSEMFLFVAGLHLVFLFLLPLISFERHESDNAKLSVSIGKG